MKTLAATLAMTALLLSAVPAFAQTAAPAAAPVGDPGHPRINEIDQRLENQQQRIDAGVAKGQINANQAVRDEKTDAKVSQELSADEAKHKGHITKAEQRQMNRQLNRNSKRIHHQRVKGQKAAAPAATTPAQ